MKLYQLTFMDLSEGKFVRWKTSKLERDRFIRQWKREHPLRALLVNEQIEIPDTKHAFVQWLNANAGSQ